MFWEKGLFIRLWQKSWTWGCRAGSLGRLAGMSNIFSFSGKEEGTLGYFGIPSCLPHIVLQLDVKFPLCSTPTLGHGWGPSLGCLTKLIRKSDGQNLSWENGGWGNSRMEDPHWTQAVAVWNSRPLAGVWGVEPGIQDRLSESCCSV